LKNILRNISNDGVIRLLNAKTCREIIGIIKNNQSVYAAVHKQEGVEEFCTGVINVALKDV